MQLKLFDIAGCVLELICSSLLCALPVVFYWFVGHRITLISNYFDPLTDGGIGYASKVYNSKHQAAILDQTKSVAEAGLQFIALAKVLYNG